MEYCEKQCEDKILELMQQINEGTLTDLGGRKYVTSFYKERGGKMCGVEL